MTGPRDGGVSKKANHGAEEGQFPVAWPPSSSNSNYKYFFCKRAKGLEAAVEEGQNRKEVVSAAKPPSRAC